MDVLDTINSSLALNGNLTKEVKDHLFDLVVIFNRQFKDVKLDNLSKRLLTLKIEKTPKFLNNDISMYDFKRNIIYINTNRMDKNYDVKHILMFELLNMITACEYHTGFNQNNQFEALNIGFTEILANYLVGNNGDELIYPDEAIEANLISVIIGPDTLYKAYFNNDTKLLMETFQNMGVEV